RGIADHAVERQQVGPDAAARVGRGLLEDRRTVELELGATDELDRGDLGLVAVAGYAVGGEPLQAHRSILVESKVDEDIGLAHGARIPRSATQPPCATCTR